MKIKIKKIETKRCILIPFQKKFITNKYINWLNDPEIVKFSRQRFFKHNFSSCTKFMKKQKVEKNIFLAILHKKPEIIHIGNFLINYNEIEDIADLSIIIGEKEFWGLGIATEIWLGTIKTLSLMKIRKLTSGTSKNNKGMKKVLKKTMKLEYTIPQNLRFDEKFIDSLHYAYYPKIKND